VPDEPRLQGQIASLEARLACPRLATLPWEPGAAPRERMRHLDCGPLLPRWTRRRPWRRRISDLAESRRAACAIPAEGDPSPLSSLGELN